MQLESKTRLIYLGWTLAKVQERILGCRRNAKLFKNANYSLRMINANEYLRMKLYAKVLANN